MRQLVEGVGFGTTEITVLRPGPLVTAEFLSYAVQTQRFRSFGAGAMTGAGGLKRVPDEFTRNFNLAIPSVGEQRVIADYVNNETARIYSLIEKKTRFIELLREKHQAIITQAVTKGLNPNVSIKNSEIECLGEIPKHWFVKRIKFFIDRIESGKSVNATDVSAGEGEIAVLKTSCVYGGVFNVNKNKVVIPDEIGLVSCPLRPGSLIVSRMNTPELVGAAGLVSEARKGIFLPDRLWQLTLHGMNPAYAHLWTRSLSYRHQVKLVCAGTSSTMQNISQEQFSSFFVATPSLEEQQIIVNTMDELLGRIEALIKSTERSIELLKERRSALITAAVTGQIDLREAA